MHATFSLGFWMLQASRSQLHASGNRDGSSSMSPVSTGRRSRSSSRETLRMSSARSAKAARWRPFNGRDGVQGTGRSASRVRASTRRPAFSFLPPSSTKAAFETMLEDIDHRLTGSILFSLGPPRSLRRSSGPATTAGHPRGRASAPASSGPRRRDRSGHRAASRRDRSRSSGSSRRRPTWVRADRARRPLGNALGAALTAHGNAQLGSDRVRLDRVVDGASAGRSIRRRTGF